VRGQQEDDSQRDRQEAAADDPIPPEARRANLALWDEWARLHEGTAFYDVSGFKAGRSALMPLEAEELGAYVADGTKLLHLQCHFGLDTLSWARRGATVVGVDFSGEAVSRARRLADEVGLSSRASFVHSDVYDAARHLGAERFDVVFVSWGAIEWLPDLRRWAALIADHLAPGGRFYMAEIHPFAYMLEEASEAASSARDLHFAGRYFPSREPQTWEVEGSYADPTAPVGGHTSYSWSHGFSEILGALLGVGLRLEYLHEFPFSVAPFFDWMERDERRWWWLPDGHGGQRTDLPFSYSVMARRERAPEHDRAGV
jgi:SAM-dependent methyltransferase